MSVGGVSDKGLSNAARIAQVAAVALAVANGKIAYDLANKQYDIAKSYLGLAQDKRNYYLNLFAPCENKEVQEACAAGLADDYTELFAGRYKVAALVSVGNIMQRAATSGGRYSTGRRAAALKDAQLAASNAVAGAMNLGERAATSYRLALDDVRWARRAQALNRGRDMSAQSVSFAQFASGIFGAVGAQAAVGATGAIGYLAYSASRNATAYPRIGQDNAPIADPLSARDSLAVDYRPQPSVVQPGVDAFDRTGQGDFQLLS